MSFALKLPCVQKLPRFIGVGVGGSLLYLDHCPPTGERSTDCGTSGIDGLEVPLNILYCRVSLVNSAIVAYFMDDLQINKHFNLFKKLLFMEDGEFSLSLSNQLFEKVFGYLLDL